MLRFVFRRLLWVFPSVLGVSLVSFFLLSLVPPPAALRVERAGDETVAAARRERFLDLPLFFNVEPSDIRRRTAGVVEALLAAAPGSDEAARAGRELLRLGGAALPVLLPRLDELNPEDRARVALALAPLAERMGLGDDGKLRNPEQVVLYWNRFWETRGAEFREATARSAVRRYARYGTDARAEQLRLLDTFALPYIMQALEAPEEPGEVAQAARLLQAMAAITGRGHAFDTPLSPEEAALAVERWQRWWLVYGADYQRLAGADRVAAFALQTRYGKWVFETLVMRMGKDELGRPLLDQLLARARITMTMLALGLALAYLLAVPLGALAAWRRATAVDRAIAAAVLVPYVATPAALALVALRIGGPFGTPVIAGAVVLGLAMLADPVRQQRSELLPVLTEDYFRAALARGASPVRALVTHGLRNAMFPLITRAALELPVAVTACFVIEKALGLPGLGEATLDAVSRNDTSWLMALALAGSVLAVGSLVISDLAYALLDPRLRASLAVVRRRRA